MKKEMNEIKKEIERLMIQKQGFKSNDAEYGYRTALRDIGFFIETLEEKD